MQAFAVGQISAPVLQASPNSVEIGCAIPQSGLCFTRKAPKFQDVCLFRKTHIMLRPLRTHFAPMAASSVSAGSADYVEEPATKVKFLKSMNVPGSLTSLSLLGTGYREKVFAIIGVKVYAAGLYANPSIFKELSSWIRNSSAAATQDNSPLFTSMFQSSLEKSLEIVLVRDVDGETFWNALSEAVMPKLKKQTPVDESALSTFKGIFEGRPLKKGTRIHLTWLEPSKMLVSDGTSAGLDGQITSLNVTKALFDVFFGDSTVSPTLKDSVLTTLRSDLQ